MTIIGSAIIVGVGVIVLGIYCMIIADAIGELTRALHRMNRTIIDLGRDLGVKVRIEKPKPPTEDKP